MGKVLSHYAEAAEQLRLNLHDMQYIPQQYDAGVFDSLSDTEKESVYERLGIDPDDEFGLVVAQIICSQLRCGIFKLPDADLDTLEEQGVIARTNALEQLRLKADQRMRMDMKQMHMTMSQMETTKREMLTEINAIKATVDALIARLDRAPISTSPSSSASSAASTSGIASGNISTTAPTAIASSSTTTTPFEGEIASASGAYIYIDEE